MVLGWPAQYSDTPVPALQAKQSAVIARQQIVSSVGMSETIHQNKLVLNWPTGNFNCVLYGDVEYERKWLHFNTERRVNC